MTILGKELQARSSAVLHRSGELITGGNPQMPRTWSEKEAAIENLTWHIL